MEKGIKLNRSTRETQIVMEFDVRGRGETDVNTSLAYLDHLLTLMCFWGRFDIKLRASGDIDVDAHHLVEDVGLCLGDVFRRSLGDKKGITRIAWTKVPMDEALVEVVVDLSGRAYLVYNNDGILPPVIFGEEKDIWREFFKSFSNRAGLNLHINFLYGKNGHHLLEAAFKGLGLSLRRASALEDFGVSSTKGILE